MRNRSNRKLRFESLENRQLLAGLVSGQEFSGSLASDAVASYEFDAVAGDIVFFDYTDDVDYQNLDLAYFRIDHEPNSFSGHGSFYRVEKNGRFVFTLTNDSSATANFHGRFAKFGMDKPIAAAQDQTLVNGQEQWATFGAGTFGIYSIDASAGSTIVWAGENVDSGTQQVWWHVMSPSGEFVERQPGSQGYTAQQSGTHHLVLQNLAINDGVNMRMRSFVDPGPFVAIAGRDLHVGMYETVHATVPEKSINAVTFDLIANRHYVFNFEMDATNNYLAKMNTTWFTPSGDRVAANKIDKTNFLAEFTGTYTILISDDNFSEELGYSIMIDPRGDTPPVLPAFAPVQYVEDAAPTPLAPLATITDSDSGWSVANGSLMFANSNFVPGDRLTVLSDVTIDVSGSGIFRWQQLNGKWGFVHKANFTTNGRRLTIDFVDGCSLTDANLILRRIAFYSTSQNPTAVSRNVRVQMHDGDGGYSAVGNIDVQVTPVNDAPRINIPNRLIEMEENGPGIRVLQDATIVDTDSPNLSQGKLAIYYAATASPDEHLLLTKGTGVTINATRSVAINGVTIGSVQQGSRGNALVINFNNNANSSNVTTLLNNIVYQNRDDNPRLKRYVQAKLEDGDGGVVLGRSILLVVNPVNDAPQLIDRLPGSTSYQLNQSPVRFAPSVVMKDVDSPNFAQGTLLVRAFQGSDSSNRISIAGNYVSIQNNRWVVRSGLVIGRLLADGIGTNDFRIRFNSRATAVDIQQIIRRLEFQTVGANLPQADRLFGVIVLDGDGGVSNRLNRRVSVE